MLPAGSQLPQKPNAMPAEDPASEDELIAGRQDRLDACYVWAHMMVPSLSRKNRVLIYHPEVVMKRRQWLARYMLVNEHMDMSLYPRLLQEINALGNYQMKMTKQISFKMAPSYIVQFHSKNRRMDHAGLLGTSMMAAYQSPKIPEVPPAPASKPDVDGDE